MNKIKYILSLIIFFFVMQSGVAVSAPHKCDNPKLYGLSSDEVNMSNADFYCWEIKYLKQYHNTLSINMESYYNFYANNLTKANIEVLRNLGITPEKYDYLYKYFIDDEISDTDNFKNEIEKAIKKAKNYMKDKVEYKYGKPIVSYVALNPAESVTRVSAVEKPQDIITWALSSTDYIPGLAQLKEPSVFDPFFILFGENCIPLGNKTMNNVLVQYQDALQPIGVVGKYFVNAFGETSLELIVNKDRAIFPEYKIRLPGDNKSLGEWNSAACGVTDFNRTMKKAFSCTPCTMFEIAFNVVSRIGFVLYDKLSRYALDLMIVLFSCWSLLMFFDNAIKKQDGLGYIKTFFTKLVWVFIIGAFLSVSITDENNIVNYTIRPFTDFMTGYNRVMTKAIDSTSSQWTCKYQTKKLKDNKYLFSRDIKQDIVCTIERIADFNNMNILIGKTEMKIGLKEFINFKFGSGIIKILLGLALAGIFFMFNLAVPYFFIESLFNIALVVFLFPLFLMAYAFDKGKGFVKKGLDTFLSGISQIVALSIMCSVISLLMFYISSIDFYGIQKAIEENNSQEIASSMLMFFSFNTNSVLEMIYTGIISWWLMGRALEIANIFGNNKESLPETFKAFMTNTIKTATSITVTRAQMKVKTGILAEKIRGKINKEKKEKDDVINNINTSGGENEV